jgi:RNA polymerase sigma-70 factor, ECF subfamily
MLSTAARSTSSRIHVPKTPVGLPDQPESSSLEQIFEAKYREFKVPIERYLRRLVGNQELAENLTGDTFLKAWQALPRMALDSLQWEAWLYRIATNTAFDTLRQRKLVTWLPLSELGHAADTEHTDPQVIYSTTELVRATLRRMPPHYKVALLLYTQEGFSYREIAKALGMVESGVKMLLSRARQSFREQYRALVQEQELPRAST